MVISRSTLSNIRIPDQEFVVQVGGDISREVFS